ncbi:hypothetical protein DPMN_037977 [Dreissena polymorpha]|uniref:Uncharacterized protein n=1 Tax=Dreissena polymorpha TaxID=45954 RepID=A0A9D4EHY5_DREPO|nr:hypothetical protein DPMN_084982 [Dreissena polymorpha]KAH3739938.1 hypothetical protein DPMN_046628 [Dreissena polymorpha]KAH3779668.1 hypothetical protein DPMN_157473 [Dreissena polymorpha]KAH3813818.1 hypothetical protein DPMN_142287 [Dreissena polymorpha]KAH3835728.1 hypothetical protein DPMN_109089 [Dreissena polymorpha]
MLSCEFVAAMVANYLECKQFEDSNDSLCDIVECVILLVNSTVTMHVLTKYDLINSCVDEDYFAELLEQKLNSGLSWDVFVTAFVLFVAVVHERSKYNLEGFYHLVKIQDVFRKYRLNDWVEKQPGKWNAFVHYCKHVC